MFVDEVEVEVHAGHGGAGCVAFHREKFVTRGGPSGGDGGRGGSVIFEAHEGLNTLQDFRRSRQIRAQNGTPGQNKRRYGRDGQDVIIPVPAGTLVRDLETGDLLGDLTAHGERLVVAQGGQGGRGNVHYKSSTRQAPEYAQPGEPGETRRLRLELKLLADIGLLGYPSVGKSTLIRQVSNARPQVAAFPFTTLTPKLGVVTWREHESYVIADIPGLIEGASEGKGLGHQFLRHLERTRLLVHLIEVPPPMGAVVPADADDETVAALEALGERDPIGDFERLNRELARFNPDMVEQPQVVVLNKVDLPYVRDQTETLRAHFEGLGCAFHAVSAVTGAGISALVDALGARLQEMKRQEQDA